MALLQNVDLNLLWLATKWTALTAQFPQTLGLLYLCFETQMFFSEKLVAAYSFHLW